MPTIILLCGFLFNKQLIAQPSRLLTAPNDKFSKAFLRVYKEAPEGFDELKSKQVKTDDTDNFRCRKILPGSVSGNIAKGNSPECIFNFESYEALPDAEEAMLKLSAKITYALLQRTMVKYIDSSEEQYLVKRTAIAEMKNGGFSGYNILVDVIKNDDESLKKYKVQLKIKGGNNTLYRLIYKNEPVRSTLFTKNFKKLFVQFDETDSYYCSELLPGFECTTIDSLGKQQLMMEKHVSDFPDARVEFESLTSNLRANLNDKFFYYLPAVSRQDERNVVFIHGDDYEKTERKSISTHLVRDSSGGYSVRVIMYHP